MRVDDVAGNGPVRYCSPRHWKPFHSRYDGSNCVSMTWRDTFARPYPRRRAIPRVALPAPASFPLLKPVPPACPPPRAPRAASAAPRAAAAARLLHLAALAFAAVAAVAVALVLLALLLRDQTWGEERQVNTQRED